MVELRIVLLLYSLLSFFVAGGLFFQKKGRSYLLLAVFIFLFGLEMLYFLYSTSALALTFPTFIGIYYFLVGFLYGPVLWFHFSVLFFPERKTSNFSILHFVPFVIVFIIYADVFFMPSAEKMEYIRLHFYDRIMPLNYTRAMHLVIYGIGFLWLLFRNADKLTIKNRVYAIAVCIIYFLTAVIISWLTLFADNWRQFIIYYLVASTLVTLVGILLYNQPGFLDTVARKYLRSGLDEETMKRISGKIQNSFANNQVYLQREFSLDKLSSIIEEKPHFLSQTLSEWVGENFNDFVNRHRIEYSKSLLSNPRFDHFKIEAIALESGFNNKVTFNKAFVKFVSCTPSAFRKKHG